MALAAILRRHAAWLAVPLGAVHALAFAPLACWPIGIGCLALLWAAWDGTTPFSCGGSQKKTITGVHATLPGTAISAGGQA